MRRKVHLANTDSELELSRSYPLSLENSLSHHPLCLQLQFLPLLYANPEDLVAVTTLPDANYLETLAQILGGHQNLPQLILLKEANFSCDAQCLSWGPSLAVKKWTEAHHLYYEMPEDWKMIQEVNSKAFSFQYTSLSDAALLFNETELFAWLKKVPGKKVLKTCFGVSGQGHRKIEDVRVDEILKFCQREWQQKRPLIAEPWLKRLFDFSTQWFIYPNQKIEYIGAMRFETEESGRYQGTWVGLEPLLFSGNSHFLDQHCQLAQKPLQKMAQKGFFGHVGIDALVYQDQETKNTSLYPIVEINARQTLSLVALRLQRRLYPNQIFHLSFLSDPSLPSLLPSQLKDIKGKVHYFRKKLIGKPSNILF